MPRDTSASTIRLRPSRRALILTGGAMLATRPLPAGAAGATAIFSPIYLVAEGDSITFGIGSSGVGHRFADIAAAVLPAGDHLRVNVIATPGIAASTIDSDYASRAGAAFVPGAFNILTLLAGTNDGATEHPEAIFRNLRAIIQKARRTGYGRILIGTLPSVAVAHPRADRFDADTLPLNLLIRRSWNTDLATDGLIDFAASPIFATAAATADRTYYLDGVHMTDAGYAAMGRIAAPVIQQAVSSVEPGQR